MTEGKASTPQNHINPRENLLHPTIGQLTRTLGQEIAIQGYDLRDICHRILWQSRQLRRQQYITGSSCSAQVRCQWHANSGADLALVDSIALHDNHRPSKPWTGSRRLRQFRPPNFASSDYHSLCSRMRRETAETNSSFVSPHSASDRFMASVISSGEWRCKYSRTASVYKRLRVVLVRRACRSALSKISLGTEIAVFIPLV